ncbi:hypothetical protein RHSIM_Rhsim10G0169000 [Rhododendron simsii]|uniref:RING-type E3 ubiquitin transferase n=1 Tax=Rhododendron simsii TaxID=118357 RepID=A0A834LDA1_RHOSS|nr:hypothetical protein RHSIM_Rhsim10G0169000 [Rhododendron simsii]
MAVYRGRFLLAGKDCGKKGHGYDDGDGDCVFAPPPAPPSKSHIPLIVILLCCALGTAFFVVSYLSYIKKYYTVPNDPRRRNRNPPPVLDDQEDFVDHNQGPVLDHPIWYIRTVGLPQSVIDSITVFNYKKDEGLTDGTGCSVCLSEFEEDETLRLLPKCSHAFHIQCIDTWLTSHKNCPLCRAPIVCGSAGVSAPELSLGQLGPGEETLVENSETGGELGSDQVMGDLPSANLVGLPSEQGRFPEILRKNPRISDAKNGRIRVQSDLADHRVRVEEVELESVRRSISMDASLASMIYLDVANIPQLELEGSSSTRLVEFKKLNSEKVGKRVRRNLSLSRLMNGSSVRFSLHNGPVSMKRSFSSSGKFSLPRKYTRSQDSILPL